MDKSEITMYSAVDWLLRDVCVVLGFCIPPKDAERIRQAEYLESDDFSCRVITAEGMTPEYEKKWKREIGAMFIERFGQEISKDEFKQNS